MTARTLAHPCGCGAPAVSYGSPGYLLPVAYRCAACIERDMDAAYIARFAALPPDEMARRLAVAQQALKSRSDALAGHDDDDPTCVCGTSLSEHALCGCPEGFQSPASWAAERQAIYAAVAREDDDARFYDTLEGGSL